MEHEVAPHLGSYAATDIALIEREELQAKHGARYHLLGCLVLEAMTDVPRASSLAENLNSRVRNYFFLRHHIGNGYLDLLRFYLNHHRFNRSDRAEHVGKSPVELLSGQNHPLVGTTRIPTFPAKLRANIAATVPISRTQKQRPPSLQRLP